jgi:hypothetical protein
LTTFAILATLAAWWGATRWRAIGALKMLQLLVFGTLGVLFFVFGGFAYWWDSGGFSSPGQASRVVPVCGVLILLAEFVLIALGDDAPDR